MRTIIITGANTGIGAACALAMAAPGVHLVLACRSAEKTEPVLEAVRARGARASFLLLDLASVEQATASARDFLAVHGARPLDLLINNAGLGGQRGITKNGFELAFGVNHLGHFAFTLPLLAALEASRGRIVNVSSGNHFNAREIPWSRITQRTRSYTGLPEYAVSKLCNVLFTAELRRRHSRITSVSMNPGRIQSDIFRRMPGPLFAMLKLVAPMKPVEVGGERLVHAATVSLEGDGAPLYFDKGEPRAVNPAALREDLAAELWAYSLRAVATACAEPAAAA
jgi:retinol dehydrogenase 12